MTTDDSKPAAEAKPENVQMLDLKIVGQANGEEVQFRFKATTPLSKLFRAYADRVGKSLGSLRFTFDGERLSEDQTAAGAGMENGDMIEAFASQIGGHL